MDAAKVAAAFNEWMRRYTADPEGFTREFQAVGQYLAERAMGEVPSYGAACAAYLEQLLGELG